MVLLALITQGKENLRSIPPDLTVPKMMEGAPGPGKRVRQAWPEEKGTAIHHALYLPPEWKPGGTYPVLVEYAGNGGYRNLLGDSCDGVPEGCSLGYGITAGRGAIWLCLPFVDKAGKKNTSNWWGDPEASEEYTVRTIKRVCSQFGGDPKRVVLCGFSRGSIGCSFIGLRDEKVSALWRGFICHSHFDGVISWGYEGSDAEAAKKRLARLNNRPVFISHEVSTAKTRGFLKHNQIEGRFTFVDLPYPNHSDQWTLRDIKEREKLREWWREIIRTD